jgi:hypothetical protein
LKNFHGSKPASITSSSQYKQILQQCTPAPDPESANIRLVLSRNKSNEGNEKEEYAVRVGTSDGKWEDSHTFSGVNVDDLLELGFDPKKFYEKPCQDIFKLLFGSKTRADEALSRAKRLSSVLLHIKDEKLMRIPWEFACRDRIDISMLVLTNRVVRVVDKSFSESKNSVSLLV